jgi:carboxymethylenebutenolidase
MRVEINRRELLQSLAAVSTSCAIGYFFLESNARASSLPRQKEAQSDGADGEMIHYPSSSGKYQIAAHMAPPKASGPHPAVILVHENHGLDENIKVVARRFAAEGFVALAPDLLSPMGGTASMPTERAATVAVRRLNMYGTVDDLKASFDYLEKDQAVDAQKVAAVGFDWGGWRTFSLAATVPNLYKAVVYYGATPDDGLDEIKAPVLAHYAERDGRWTGQAVWTREQMTKMGKQYQFFIYPDTDHDFFNPENPAYDPAAAKLSWARTLAFLRNQPLPNTVALGKDDVKKPGVVIHRGLPDD